MTGTASLPPAPDALPVTVGFMPLVDAALLVVAKENGLAAAEGINLVLVREGSWAAIRDKLNVGLFDAAHMLAPAAIASMLGLAHIEVPLIAPVALNLDGNAVTVSNGLAERLVATLGEGTDASPAMTARALAAEVARRRQTAQTPLTIGVVFGYSCHVYQIEAWLRLGGIDPERDVRLVVIPPPLMVESLAMGLIDLFCAGSPWNRMAEASGAGRVLHAVARILPDCPEKLLVMRSEAQSAPWLPGLLRAIARAAEWAGNPDNHPALASLLARPDYVDVPASVIEGVLRGTGATLFNDPQTPWIRLDPDAIKPSLSRLDLVFQMMLRSGAVGAAPALRDKATSLLRPDLFSRALAGPEA
jgi:NitT/TauT family transport system ATP-binding protein